MRFLQGPAGTALKYALSAAVLGWLVSRVEWSRLAGLSGVDRRLFLSALLLAGLAYPLQAWRWQLLLRTQGIRPLTRWVHGVFWIGNFYNSFLPGGVAGDAVRFTYLWQAEPGRRAGAAASLVADRLLGLASLCALAALALGCRLALAGGGAGLAILFAASSLTLVALLMLGWMMPRPHRWSVPAERLFGRERAALLHTAATALGANPGTLAGGAVISLGIWLLDFVSLWLLAGSIGLHVGLLEMSVAGAAAYVAASLPISIGGHGVREGTLIAVLALLGIGAGQPETTALFALAFWALSAGWSAVGGAVQLVSLLTGWPLPRVTPPADPQ